MSIAKRRNRGLKHISRYLFIDGVSYVLTLSFSGKSSVIIEDQDGEKYVHGVIDADM